MSKRAASDSGSNPSKKSRQEVQPDAEKPQCPICMEACRACSIASTPCAPDMAGILTQSSKR
jgi:hypothetical protein